MKEEDPKEDAQDEQHDDDEEPHASERGEAGSSVVAYGVEYNWRNALDEVPSCRTPFLPPPRWVLVVLMRDGGAPLLLISPQSERKAGGGRANEDS